MKKETGRNISFSYIFKIGGMYLSEKTSSGIRLVDKMYMAQKYDYDVMLGVYEDLKYYESLDVKVVEITEEIIKYEEEIDVHKMDRLLKLFCKQ